MVFRSGPVEARITAGISTIINSSHTHTKAEGWMSWASKSEQVRIFSPNPKKTRLEKSWAKRDRYAGGKIWTCTKTPSRWSLHFPPVFPGWRFAERKERSRPGVIVGWSFTYVSKDTWYFFFPGGWIEILWRWHRCLEMQNEEQQGASVGPLKFIYSLSIFSTAEVIMERSGKDVTLMAASFF